MEPNNFPPSIAKSKVKVDKVYQIKAMLKELDTITVCESAHCPNIGECFSKPTVTFIILGKICSRNCLFCSVEKGKPRGIDFDEPLKIAHAAQRLGLKHMIITSVARDDLADGGAFQFAYTIHTVRNKLPHSSIEILAHDFLANTKSLRTILDCNPNVFNHNVQSVPRIYQKLQPDADYMKSLKVLKTVKRLKPNIYTKSGLMVGLGETEEEVIKVMKDLREVKCDILNIGQYLQPTRYNIPVNTFITPEAFIRYKTMAMEMGFLYVESAPFVRSSYNGDSFTETLIPKNNRKMKNGAISSYQEASSVRF